MVVEAVAAALIGVAALWLVLQPLLSPRSPAPLPAEPLDPEETPKGVALTALREIEFDRETGKLSDQDYQLLKTKYTTAAVEAFRAESVGDGAPDDVEAMIAARVRSLRSAATSTPSAASRCPICGPRPESDAVFCSSCGLRLPQGPLCTRCGAELPPDSRFCAACGTQVAA
ncbi:MAG TPA: zinc ribbon domain-containing protein [Gemmatimonadales bacterium]|jgi:rRNA maturation endonuclease Nob1